MSKGSWKRPCFVPKDQYDKNFEAVFGKKKPNVMFDEEGLELDHAGFPLLKYSPGGSEYDRDREQPQKLASEYSIDEPYWTGPGYRGEYNCPHGVGHGNHAHACDGCCSREDFPLTRK